MGLIALDICNTLADINLLLEEALGPVPNPHQYYHPKVTINTQAHGDLRFIG